MRDPPRLSLRFDVPQVLVACAVSDIYYFVDCSGDFQNKEIDKTHR